MDIQKVKDYILDLAIRGKLVSQDPNDEPVSALVERIKQEKDKLIKEGKIKKEKELSPITKEEIPFEIPSNWEWVKLGEISGIVGGGTPDTSNFDYWTNGNIPWITPADMNKCKYISKGKRNITEKGLKNSSAVLLPKGTVLFSSRAPIGYVGIANNEISSNQGLKSSIPIIMDMNEYIYWYLILCGKKINKNASGTTFNEVSGEIVKNIILSLPPIEEQKRIVNRIEELFDILDNLKKEKNEYDKYKELLRNKVLDLAIRGKLVEQDPNDESVSEIIKRVQKEKEQLIKEGKIKKDKELSHITEKEKLFEIPANWKWVRLDNISYNYSNKSKQISQKQILKIGKYPVVSQSQSLIEGYYDEESKLVKVINPVIVFGDHTRCIKYIDFNFVIGADGIKIINPININSRYFYFACMYNALNLENRGYSRHYSYFNKVPIPLPPIEEQKRIVDKIENIYDLINKW